VKGNGEYIKCVNEIYHGETYREGAMVAILSGNVAPFMSKCLWAYRDAPIPILFRQCKKRNDDAWQF
jgi:hypothetical protein